MSLLIGYYVSLTGFKCYVNLVTMKKLKENEILEQSVNVESEFSHNYRGAEVATFNEGELRHANRGAILANIFERHTTEDYRGKKQLMTKDFKNMLYEVELSLAKIPRDEQEEAKRHMKLHLAKRGYNG